MRADEETPTTPTSVGRGLHAALVRSRHVVALVLAALVLVGCSGEDKGRDSPTSTAAEFNEADVSFARAMLPHGEQGADMSEIVLKINELDPDVRALATELARNRQASSSSGWPREANP